MSTHNDSRGRWLTYGGVAVAIILVLAAMHFAFSGNLFGWIGTLHGQ